MPWRTGSHLTHYELIQALGAGGMGEVWLATDTRLQRKVTIKLLPAALTGDPARTRRFEQEARAASGLLDANKTEVFASSAFGTVWSPDSRTLAYVLVRPNLALAEEWALAVHDGGGSERIVRRWTRDSYLVPTGWTRDGQFIVGSYVAPPLPGPRSSRSGRCRRPRLSPSAC